MPKPAPTEDLIAVLNQRRLELERLSKNSAQQRDPVELDQTRIGRLSRIDALQNQAMSQAIETRRHQELQRIDAALARLETGDFGRCLICGEDISVQRLRSDPATPVCIDCAS